MDTASSPAMLPAPESMDLYHEGEMQDKENQCPLLCTQRILEISPAQHNLSSATKSKVQGMQTAPT